MRKIWLSLIILVLVPLYSAEEDLPAFPGLRSKEFIEADFDSLLIEWSKFIEQHPDSFEAVFALSRILNYKDRMSDWRTVESALEKALSSKLTNGYVESSYKQALRMIYESKGLRERADNLNAYEGTVTEWFYVGGFGGSYGSGAVFEVFSPEKDIFSNDVDVLKKRYELGDGKTIVWWRKATVRKPISDPSIYLRTPPGIIYALAQFESPEEKTAVLHISGLNDYTKLFFNEQVVYEYDSQRFRKPDFALIAVRLNKGYNQILVKTTRSFITLALRDENGFPLTGLKFETDPVFHPIDLKSDPVIKEGYKEGLLSHYEKKYLKRTDDTDTAIAYALLLSERGMGVRALEVLEEALEKNPEDGLLCYFAARMYEKADHCPKSWRRSQAKTLIDTALKKNERFVLAREMLADFLAENDKFEESVREIKSILEAGIKRVSVYRKLAELCSRKEWVKEELEAVKSAESLNPNDEWVLSYWRNYYERNGNRKKAREYATRYYELYDNSDSYKGYQAQVAEDDGDIDRALEIYEEFVSQDPTNIEKKLDIAHLLERNGRYADALRHYKMLLEEHSDEVSTSLFETIARLYVLLGDTDNAVEWYRKSLLFSPSDWTTRRYIQFLKKEEEDFFKKYALSEEAVKELLKDSPTSKEYPKSGVLTLLSEDITLVLPTGTTSTCTHTIDKVLKEDAKDEVGSTYAAGEIRILRTITPDGRIYEPTPSGRGSFAMTNLSKDAFVEELYRRDSYRDITIDTTSWYKDVFRSFHIPYHFKRSVLVFLDERLSEEDAKLMDKFGYKVVYPVDNLKLRLRNFTEDSKISLKIQKEDGATVYIFEAKELNIEDPERYTPSSKEIFPNIEFVAEKVERTRNLPRLRAALRDAKVLPTKLIEEEALKIVEGAKSDVEKAKRLYEWCNLNIKEGSYYDPAHTILINKAGDRNTLFHSFIKALKIPYNIVLVGSNPRRIDVEQWSGGDISNNFREALFLFKEAGREYYVTLDARYAPFGKIPEDRQDAPAFVISENELRFTFLPKEPLKNRMEQKVVMDIDLESLTCTGEYEYLTSSAYNYKDEFAKKSSDDLKREVEELLGERFSGMTLISFDMPDLKVVGSPLVIKFTCTVPSALVERKDGAFDLNHFITPLKIQEQVAGKSERKYPMFLNIINIDDEISSIGLGNEYEVVSIPQPCILNSPVGFYALTFSQDKKKNIIKVERYFALFAPRIEAKDYSIVLGFAKKIDEAEMAKIVVRKRQESGK